ncbi:putative lipopolysaccharide heptosyltransferase III [Xenorhabdus griffiniae]|uniref:Lipopolysaccharide heptosyltransferase III n=1 Tax=Xenorhabdus griffiniae TaxID=351672 RepID=A0ABY9XHY4_9GAMM|nr:putative lipopolysaccharide heptosyltransferase III [Xenorhabdus griffiniae]MBD1227527.1 putative lipopolysaccharide heptosyltransferase III [Xenorhabdus griffiniae]MBE8588111.1 putative lipopolysaccharide heptosyltransferase III [Xenorhabdus griffiniae]WMV72438.1 putative lipopolysaccharide heptosyltransferase III [Xenorhabdus griffiniae]WNH02116.1 putative lipopolysaccharide heptosyltransferase III [Xenorhabdus griffiniae]
MIPQHNKIKRVLVIKLQHHGDMLLITPVISTLTFHYPDAKIDVLLYQETSPMLENSAEISSIFSIDRTWKQLGTRKKLLHEWTLLKTLRQQHYDLVINLADQWRSAFISRFTGAPIRLALGFPKRQNWKWRFCHTEVIPTDNHDSLHTVEQNLSILKPLQLNSVITKVTMSYSEDDLKCIKQLLSKRGFSKRYVVVQPTSRWFFKCWDEKKMAKVITTLQKDRHSIIITSGPDQKELDMVATILSHCLDDKKNILSLAGKLTLPKLAALIDHAKLFIGVDSVPMHMAAALKTPCVALFGPSKLTFWKPWQSVGEVIWAGDYGNIPHPDDIKTGTSKRYLDLIPTDAVISAARKYIL